MDMRSMRADGPNGSTLSSRTTRPLGFCANEASTSMEPADSAISCTSSTMRPPPRKSVASILYFPRTSLNLRSTISSMLLPTHLSGVPMSDVSPNSGGIRGPMSTFG